MSIEDRIARLESENRRLKIGALLGLLVMSAIFMMGQARPATRVEAESFVVRDRRGVEVASFGATYGPNSEAGGAWLAFYDYRPDGGRSIGTFFQGGSGQEGYLQLNADNGKRVVLMRTGYETVDPVISVTTPSGAQWSAP
jgi:hypothetical protein